MVILQPPPTIEIVGALLRLGSRPTNTLVVGAPNADFPGDLISVGIWELCFGMMLLVEDDLILPQLILDDFGRQHVGTAGIEFMLREGDAFPRADVFGSRVSTGVEDQFFFKQIDLAQGLHCVACKRNCAQQRHRVDVVIWVDETQPQLRELDPDDTRAIGLLRLSTRCLAMPSRRLQSVANDLAAIIKA